MAPELASLFNVCVMSAEQSELRIKNLQKQDGRTQEQQQSNNVFFFK